MEETDYKKLLEEAKEASKNSYSPYSNFPVGACVLFESGKMYKGANIENSSYGLGLCAERNALSTALTEGEKTALLAIAIYCPKQKLCLPCGACLQWLSEFYNMSNKDITVILENGNEAVTYKFSELLPHSFKIN